MYPLYVLFENTIFYISSDRDYETLYQGWVEDCVTYINNMNCGAMERILSVS